LISLTFIQTSYFVAEFRRLGLTDEDLRAIEGVVGDDPDAGKVMARTGGVRKIRFAPPSWRTGKRGALRVCYVWLERYSTVGFFLIYPKNEKDTLSAEDEKVCRLLVDRLGGGVRKAGGHGEAH
jgi:hypothetical protein